MLGVLLLTLRELRAKWVVVGLFVVATVVWGAMALALQLDVVDGTLAGARIFGQDASFDQPVFDPETGEPVVDPETGEVAMAEPEMVPGASSMLESLVFGAQVFVAGAAYWVGILLALFATSGLVASLMAKGEVDLFLAKPLSRSAVLAGRIGGVWAVTLALVAYLIGAVWLVMSLKSGIWNPRFLLAIPVVWSMFAVLYGVVTLVSTWTGSGALSLLAVLALLFVTLVLAIPELPTQLKPWLRPVVTGLKWALPQFPSVGARLVPQLATGEAVGALAAYGASLGVGAVLYGLGFLRFARRDF